MRPVFARQANTRCNCGARCLRRGHLFGGIGQGKEPLKRGRKRLALEEGENEMPSPRPDAIFAPEAKSGTDFRGFQSVSDEVVFAEAGIGEERTRAVLNHAALQHGGVNLFQFARGQYDGWAGAFAHVFLKRPKYLTSMDEASCFVRCETLAIANLFPLDCRVFNSCVKKSVENCPLPLVISPKSTRLPLFPLPRRPFFNLYESFYNIPH